MKANHPAKWRGGAAYRSKQSGNGERKPEASWQYQLSESMKSESAAKSAYLTLAKSRGC
jgi:hypothetical protein